jgi:hypothetical protein
MTGEGALFVTGVISAILNRRQLAGGWIEQPFVFRLYSRLLSFIIVARETAFCVTDRSGCGGDHFLITSMKQVPGSFQVTNRIAS